MSRLRPLPLEITLDRRTPNHSNAIPNRCPVCEGRSNLLVAVPTPTCLTAYFACESCALVKIVQH
ncbi:MAG TPA: hypothetical protein VFB45_19160 [Pseudolabrys sp.]|nr:hypothetical protein [Pseudolabrys sp.]